ncbi:hypothetical protein M9458_052679, partial [Cirrhinus mrigala]
MVGDLPPAAPGGGPRRSLGRGDPGMAGPPPPPGAGRERRESGRLLGGEGVMGGPLPPWGRRGSRGKPHLTGRPHPAPPPPPVTGMSPPATRVPGRAIVPGRIGGTRRKGLGRLGLRCSCAAGLRCGVAREPKVWSGPGPSPEGGPEAAGLRGLRA